MKILGTLLSNYKLGDLIEAYVEYVGVNNLKPDDVSGINKDKEFFEPSQSVGTNTSNYRVVPQNYFACNLMHVGRDKVLPIALNTTSKFKVVSPAYTVFKVKSKELLLDEYFFMIMKSKEMDRYFWFKTDSSVRDGLSWKNFCNITISLPNIEIQRRYSSLYKSLRQNFVSLSTGNEDLEATINIIVDKIKHTSEKYCVGNFLSTVDERNTSNFYGDVMGINIDKTFMPSKSSSDKLTNYKVVRQGEFAYNSMQTGRDKCIRIALYDKSNPCLVSPSYSVLKVTSELVIPEYIQLWFSRSESDRRGAFMTDSSIRSNLDLDTFFQIEIPIPKIETQKAVVDLYLAVKKRNKVANQLAKKISDICPVLVKGSRDDKFNW